MRIEVLFTDRVGIAQEILAALARRAFNLTAVEVDPPRIWLEAPALDQAGLQTLSGDLMQVPGVQQVKALGMLPGAQRRLYLDALLASQPDPVLAVDETGCVVLTNQAAQRASGLSATELVGRRLAELLGLPELDASLDPGLGEFRHPLPGAEVVLGGQAYLLEALPLREAGGRVAGGMFTLHAPSRMGERLAALSRHEGQGFDALLGQSPLLLQLKQRAARMAVVDAPLLITGETGTGKELLAHACHAASGRSQLPFFALNCAALPENLAESELFGYSPGAFTGALRGGKPGLLELADGGTVFLDEVGEMSPYLQAKLLRFLNDGSFRRVGGDREIRVNVRMLSATHQPLDEMVETGRFRRDLYFRLNVLNLHMPALRERPEDILPLAQALLERACAQAGHPAMRLSAGACAALQANPWPGNVRQLQNVIFRAVTMTDRRVIEAADLELAQTSAQPAVGLPGPGGAPVASLEQAVADFEKALLTQLYREHPSSRQLAQRLGSSHSAIAIRLKRYGIGRA